MAPRGGITPEAFVRDASAHVRLDRVVKRLDLIYEALRLLNYRLEHQDKVFYDRVGFTLGGLNSFVVDPVPAGEG